MSNVPFKIFMDKFILRLKQLKLVRARIYNQEYFNTKGDPLPIAVEFQKSIKKNPDILMFGDSVCLRVAKQDEDKRPLWQMVVEKLTPKNVSVTCFSAYTSYMHSAFLGLARKMKAKPEWVVISYNIRCSSPQWDASPVWQYTQENAILQALINNPKSRPGSVAPVYLDKKVHNEVAFSSPLSPWQNVGEFKQNTKHKRHDAGLERQRQKNILILHYGSPMYKYHRQPEFLCTAIREALEMNAKVLVYLTPINMDFIQDVGGNELVNLIHENCNRTKSAIDRAGLGEKIVFQDWTGALSPEHFFHPEELTEHLAEKGRAELSNMIVKNLSTQGYTSKN